MKTINNPKIYSMPSRIVHWVMALLLTINILIGFLFDQISPAFKQFLLPLHQILGICLIGLFFVRIIFLILHRRPPLPSSISKLEKVGIKCVHMMMYFLMITIPLSGIFKVQAKGKILIIFGWHAPVLVGKNSMWYGYFSDYHEIATFVLVALIGMHLFGILNHHFIKKIDILQRMSIKD